MFQQSADSFIFKLEQARISEVNIEAVSRPEQNEWV